MKTDEQSGLGESSFGHLSSLLVHTLHLLRHNDPKKTVMHSMFYDIGTALKKLIRNQVVGTNGCTAANN